MGHLVLLAGKGKGRGMGAAGRGTAGSSLWTPQGLKDQDITLGHWRTVEGLYAGK